MIFLRIIATFCLLFAIASCSKSKVSYHYPNNQDVDRRSKNTGRFLSGNWTPLAEDKKIKTDTESNYDTSRLWQTSVQVIGLLFPISIIDEKSGIIATEWYQENPQSSTRIKVNVLIRDEKNLEESIRVSVFEQRREKENSSWQAGTKDSESVARSAMKAQKIKDEILRRTKQEELTKELIKENKESEEENNEQ